MAHLEVYLPEREPLIVPLKPGVLSIGRGEDCDIQIPSKFVSSRHTSIELAAIVSDLGSTNGTWVGDDRVESRPLRDGESFHFGWRDQVRLKLHLEEGAASTGTAALPDEARDAVVREELAQERSIVREQKKEIDRLHARIAELEAREADEATAAELTLGGAVPMESTESSVEDDPDDSLTMPTMVERANFGRGAHDSPMLAARVAALEGELSTARAEVERLGTEVQGLGAERESLQKQLATARASGPSSPIAGSAPKRRPAAPARAANSSVGEVETLVEAFGEHCGLDIDQPLLETMRRRADFPADFGYVCGRLLCFSRDVEQLISAMSLSFRGTSRLNEGNVTLLPGGDSRENLRRGIQALLVQGGPDLRQAFEGHLQHLGKWYLACISAYKAGIERWYPDFRARLSRQGIEGRTKVGGMLRLLGLQYREYWDAYGQVLDDLTAEIVIDEIEQAAAREAVKIVEAGRPS